MTDEAVPLGRGSVTLQEKDCERVKDVSVKLESHDVKSEEYRADTDDQIEINAVRVKKEEYAADTDDEIETKPGRIVKVEPCYSADTDDDNEVKPDIKIRVKPEHSLDTDDEDERRKRLDELHNSRILGPKKAEGRQKVSDCMRL